ncbi:MAG: carboxypeptidase regulatory-like domain-containing protein [Labilithrix sp.]|nr:carboxypeptidase regulatory-like domain-containing protein [Labilithrix sp.]
MARVTTMIGVALVSTMAIGFVACGSVGPGSGFPNGDGDGNDQTSSGGPLLGPGGNDGGAKPCVGLECQIVSCAGGATTTLTGKVYAPEGTVPLYNAIVYVPNAPVDAFVNGVTCDKCGKVSGSPIVTALTNEKGEFKLENVPAGTDIPVVIQIGKWRRQIKVSTVNQCVENAIPAGETRLPRSRVEGDIPQIALTSGNADSLECFLRKLGLTDPEFTAPTGPGRVHYFTGNGATLTGGTPAAATLWNNLETLKKYDIAVLSCEGSERTGDKQAYYENIKNYLDAGGRAFASHFHYVWFRYGPNPLPTTAAWANPPNTSGPYAIDTDFPKGNAFADWLVNVGASTTRGTIALEAVRNSVGDSAPAVSRRWIHSPSPTTAKYFTFNTPIGVPPDNQCGRAVFTDVHVSVQGATGTFPNFCNNNPLNANEKALIFLFFDLSSCVQDESKPPVLPGPK